MRTPILLLFSFCLAGQDIHHVITTGQSLSVSSTGGTPTLSTTQSRGNLMLSGSSFVPLVEGVSEAPASGLGNNANVFGGGRVYLLTKVGVGGYAYDNLKGPCATTTGACASGGTSSYRNGINAVITAMASAVAAGRNYYVDAVVVTHGESDYGNPINDTAAAYAAKLLEWQGQWTADINGRTSHTGEIPLIVDQMHSWTVTGPAWTTPTAGGQGAGYPAGVPIGQWQAARDNPAKIYLCTPKYMLPYFSDGLHLTNVSARWLGAMQGRCVDRVVRQGLPWRPLVPGRITRSGAVVTLEYHVPAGVLVLDTANVSMPAAGNYGFEWYEEGGSGTAISSVSVTGSNRVQIMLTGVPTGTNQRIRYAYTGVRYNHAGPATGPRGNLRDTETATSIDGDPLWDWGITFDEPVGFTWGAEALPGGAMRVSTKIEGRASVTGATIR